MKPARNPKYLAWIRTQPCLVCGSTRWIEAAHTGPHGLGQKSPDSSAVPLCAKHHRTGNDSYHRLGPRKFNEVHNLNLAEIVRRLNLKPVIHLQQREFVAYLEGCRYQLGKSENGIASALRVLRSVCGENRLALEISEDSGRDPRLASERSPVSYSFQEPEWPVFCECKYDEARDEMDREDCSIHQDLIEQTREESNPLSKPSRPVTSAESEESAA